MKRGERANFGNACPIDVVALIQALVQVVLAEQLAGIAVADPRTGITWGPTVGAGQADEQIGLWLWRRAIVLEVVGTYRFLQASVARSAFVEITHDVHDGFLRRTSDR
ncbi:hypothetical protein D3C80_1204710 [compost metagenome]